MKNYEILLCEEYLVPIPYKKGDINKDGIINIDDGILLDEYLNAPRDLTDEEKDLMDINKDRLVNSNDSSELIKVMAGITLPTDSNVYRQELRVRFVAEIGSSSSTFSGKAIDPIFYTKIDGTHELTFELPKYYFDENTGEKVFNELTDLLVNKCKILLRFPDEGEDYYLVINERADEEKDGQFKYTYSCNDAFIEELSKTGYGLVFDDDVEGNGLADIHQLAEEILLDTDWDYDRKETGYMGEYRTEVNYNTTQERYDTVQIPHPVHPIKYIPELKRYCYKLDPSFCGEKEIYCYEDTEQVTSNTVKNILYNTSETVDSDGWNAQNGFIEISKDYNLKFSSSTETSFKVLNSTAVSTNTTLRGNQPYLLRIKYATNGGGEDGRGITAMEVYKNSPFKDSQGIDMATSDMTFSWENAIFNPSSAPSQRYYVFKPQQSISNPYISFTVNAPVGSYVEVESIQLFELKTRKSSNMEGTSEELYRSFLQKLYTGTCIDISSNKTDLRKKKINDDTTESITTYNASDIVVLPNDGNLSAYTHKKTMYFSQDPDSKEITYLDFETEIIDSSADIIETETDSFPILDPLDENVWLYRGTGEEIGGNGKYYNEIGLSKIYKLKSDGKYYQYYQLTKDGRTGGAWDLALLGYGVADKRRTLKAEKSNRFNLLQELAELFKTWCIFETKIGENNELQKKVYFRENVINPNFSGFHSGVNLRSLERKVESDEIVTKMYVEDVESDFAEDGFVTIRTSSLNPWGENYYYNFKYYGEQKLLSSEGIIKLEDDKKELYSTVKGINATIYELNDKIINAKMELKNLNSRLESLSYCIAAAMERIGNIDGDLSNPDISAPDKQQLREDQKSNEKRKSEYETEYVKSEKAKNILQAEYDEWVKQVEKKQEEKKGLIQKFENTYAQFIKEGVWSDSTYSDNDTYFLDSQKVSLTSAMPKMSWNISAIDGSVLHELEDFKVKVGDQTILVDNEFFPSKEAKEHVFEVLISGIKEHLDDGTKNEIEIRNYLTRFEDLFQRISAATQTLELNEQTYNRAANFTADGHIDQSLLERSLLENASILANSSDNSYKLDQTGLHLQSVINPIKKLRIVADGIVLSDSLDDEGNEKWTTGISADGINADKITTGSLDTSLIRIYSDGQPSFVWNGLGISAYRKYTSFATRKKKLGVVGDSYSIHRTGTVGATNQNIPGWIECLREMGYYTVGGNNKVTDAGPYGGKGASGFAPYYHVESTEKSREYYFRTQVKQIIDSGEWPEVILIAGGFNDRNMCVNSIDSDLKYKPFDLALPNIKEDSNLDILSMDYLPEFLGAYINKRGEYGLAQNNPFKITEEAKYQYDGVVYDITYDVFAPVTSNGMTRMMVNPVQEVNIGEKMVTWNSGNKWKDDADGDVLANEIKDCLKYIADSYSKKEKDCPEIYIVTIGRYFYPSTGGDLRLKATHLAMNEVMLKNTYQIYETAIQQFQDSNSAIKNKIHYKDISGILESSESNWMEGFNGAGQEKSHVSDCVHPSIKGTEKIAEMLSNIFDPEKNFFEINDNIPVTDEEDGKSFVRFDKYGLYSVQNKTDFNYADGIPWFSGLSQNQALSKIINNSVFSLTDKGFNLNISDTKGKISLGTLQSLPTEEPLYGLRIIDTMGKDVVNLTNDSANCTIAGWKLTSSSLRNSIPHPKDSTKELVTYLCTGSVPGATAFAMGEKLKDENTYGGCAFRVSADGHLYSTGATVSGAITAESGRIGPLTVTSTEKSTSGDKVAGAYIISEDYNKKVTNGWAERLKKSIVSNKGKATSITNELAGFGTGVNKRDIPYLTPKDIETLWKRKDETGTTYWTVKNGAWAKIEIQEFLQGKDNLCLYDVEESTLYYLVSNTLNTMTFNRMPDPTILKNKKIETIKTNCFTKHDPVIYYSMNGKYYRRGIKDGEVVYLEYTKLQDVPFNKNEMYFLPSSGRFIVYRNNEWFYLSEAWGTDCQEKEIVTITMLTSEQGNNINNIPPKETCIWYEKIQNTAGYWWQNLENGEWMWTSAKEALRGAGHIANSYVTPVEAFGEGQPKRAFYHFSKDVWLSCYENYNPKKGTAVQIPIDYDSNFQLATRFGAYHLGTGKFLAYKKINATEVVYGSPQADLVLHNDATSFFSGIPNDWISDVTDKYFYQTTPLSLMREESCYYYYNTEWKKITFDDRPRETTDNAAYEDFEKHMQNFTSMLPADGWEKISHVFVGGAWYDRTLDNDFSLENSVLLGYNLIQSGIINFCKKVNTLIPENNDKVTIVIAYLPHSNTSTAINNHFSFVAGLYRNTINSINEKISAGDNNFNRLEKIVFKDLRNDSVSKSGTWFEEDGSFDSTNYLPSSTGSDQITRLLYTPAKTYYNGLIYGTTSDAGGGKYSGGLALQGTSPSSTMLWAGYHDPTGTYATPFEDYYAGLSEGITDRWADRTPFYVTYNGTIHATGLQLSAGSKIAGWTISGNSLKYEHSTNGKIDYRFWLHGGPSIEDDSTSGNSYWIAAQRSEGGNPITKFAVKKDGSLYASNAEIYGTIYATEGNFSENVTIGGVKLKASDLYNVIGNATNGTYNGHITQIKASKGEIGEWLIDKKLYIDKKQKFADLDVFISAQLGLDGILFGGNDLPILGTIPSSSNSYVSFQNIAYTEYWTGAMGSTTGDPIMYNDTQNMIPSLVHKFEKDGYQTVVYLFCSHNGLIALKYFTDLNGVTTRTAKQLI